MKWTYDWLKEYLKTELSADEIAATLTRTGLEVEDLIQPTAPIAAKIVECTPHENSDHLHVLLVDDGSSILRQVVCGAPNARVGLISALAVPGCVIGGHEITSGKLRGVMSDGMMCSARELGIGDDHDGIIELAADTKIGSPITETKTVFDAGITPNRPDYLSVRGIAMDLSAAGVGEYIAPIDNEIKPVKSNRNVILKTDKCAVYRFAEINNIKISDSCEKIKSRLAAIGINPKNAPIDTTNYVCYDIGQPMHCFDADEIHGDIVVRMATNGEEFTDLFGNTHSLVDTDMVIADDMGILALAGVIGGARGCTSENTKNILLESAYFDPVCVRKTSKRLGISTDASYRYERGIDPTITGDALDMAAQIIMDTCGGKITGTGVAGQNPDATREIKYCPALFQQKTGIDMPTDVQHEILTKLNYKISENGDTWILVPHPSRVNIEIPENVIADLIRIYGYDNLANTATHAPSDSAPHRDYNMALKEKLATRGLNECDAYGFGNSAIEPLLCNKPIIPIVNPITTDMDTLRNNLLGDLLRFVGDNEKRGYPDLNLFIVGTVFDGMDAGAQHTQLAFVRTGATGPKHWTGRNRPHDIYDVKADIVSLLNGQRFTIDTDSPAPWAHPYRYGRIVQGKKVLAEFGELHPMVARKLKIKTPTMIGLVDDIAVLPVGRKSGKFVASDFQPVTRDFAFIVDTAFPAEKIVAAATSVDNRITDAVVFDAFEMENGTKSIAFTITIIPTENMTDADLMQIQNAVIANVEKKCNAKIRDK